MNRAAVSFAAILAVVTVWLMFSISAMPTTPTLTTVDPVAYRNASNYAAWCGGYAQVTGTDITVQGCDR